MISTRKASLAIAFTFLPLADLSAMNCHKVSERAERVICTNPTLGASEAAMSSHYMTARVALAKPLAAELVRSQRAWLVKLNTNCVLSSCISAQIAARDTILSALTAQVSDANPTLPGLHAVWLEGDWKIGPRQPNTLNSFGNLPGDGLDLTFRAGQYCEKPDDCTPFGLEAHTLDDGSNPQNLSARLRLRADAPIYVVLLYGKAEYSLVPMPDGTLLAMSDGCAKSGKPCGEVEQVWRPAGPESRVREADLSKQ